MTVFGKRNFLIFLSLVLTFGLYSQNLISKKPFTHQDAMKFKSIRSVAVSDNGNWIAYTVMPDRGDGKLYVITPDDSNKIVIERGDKPVFSNDALWMAAIQNPKSIDVENAKTPKDKPKSGMVLLRTSIGKLDEFENIKKYEFSNDSKWLIYHKHADDSEKNDKMKKKIIGSELTLRHLKSGTEIKIPFVSEYQLDSNSKYIFYAISSVDGKRDGVYLRDFSQEFVPETSINKSDKNFYSGLAWNLKRNTLAYIQTPLRKDGRTDNGSLLLWDRNNPELTQFAVSASSVKNDWYIPAANKTKWTEDGNKLFFGLKPISEKDTIDYEDVKFTDSTFYNTDSILANSDDLIWHWNDPRISTHQVNWWGKNKERTFAAVYNIQNKSFIQIADENLENVSYSDNSNYTIAHDDSPYIKQATWGGFYTDLYVINLNTGERKKIAESLIEPGHLSPLGKHILYFKDKHWYIYDTETSKMTNITAHINIPFYDVDNDLPMEPGSYGIGGWFENDSYVLINEKYDVYKFLLDDHKSFINLSATVGRKYKITFRVKEIVKDRKVFKDRDTIYMQAYSEEAKSSSIFFFETHVAGGINTTVGENNAFIEGKNFFAILKPKNANKVIYTRESFDEFPDLWVGDLMLDSAKRITDVNPEMKDFKWGTTESVRWQSPTGDSLSGYLIKPDGFNPAKKYPVLVYYYERFSEQTYRFYQPRINHRPIYQVYLGEDYLVFVPDIHYKNGRPGTDATEAIESGLKVLIDRGIADPAKLCIQGHSWAGYQTAYIVTSSNMFAAAAAGAPVGNMTSAYSQIRTESGLARQFQYEKYQSRIGGNLWDSLDSYIRNSPVFQVEKAKTPLLILHGNVDEAVPFAQGVELYLAFRRLSKNCVMVEYKNEPHHPRKYENKLDWAVKMKEWFDHYVLGKPAAKWITEGRIYKGNK
jgi:dipeptidyl aminopeptidase/acylaminoacyl peptidase